MYRTLIATLTLAASLTPVALCAKGNDAAVRLDAAADVMTDMMNTSDKGIPQNLLNKSE